MGHGQHLNLKWVDGDGWILTSNKVIWLKRNAFKICWSQNQNKKKWENLYFVDFFNNLSRQVKHTSLKLARSPEMRMDGMLQYDTNIVFIALSWKSSAYYKMALFEAFSIAMETVTMATMGYSQKCPIQKLLVFLRIHTSKYDNPEMNITKI